MFINELMALLYINNLYHYLLFGLVQDYLA
jgi:hypothetical protein